MVNFNKARRAFYTIKKSTKLDILIQIWLKILHAVIEPISIYGCDVWDQLAEGILYKMG